MGQCVPNDVLAETEEIIEHEAYNTTQDNQMAAVGRH